MWQVWKQHQYGDSLEGEFLTEQEAEEFATSLFEEERYCLEGRKRSYWYIKKISETEIE